MTVSYLNGCVWSSATTGTGAFTVFASVSPYFTPAGCTNPSVTNGGTYNYIAIQDSQYEIGQGTFTSGANTLSRAQIFSSSNAGSTVDFAAVPTVYMGTTLAAYAAFSTNVSTLAAPGNWKVNYTNGSGVQTALTVGAAGTALAGNGATAAPSWQGVCLTANNLSDVVAATARSNLGLAIGSNVQAYSANLATLSAPGNWKVNYTDGSGVQTALTVGAAGTALAGNGVTAAPSWQGVCLTANNLSDVVAATARSNLGLAIGSNVQAYSANLATMASPGNWKMFYSDGSGVVTALTTGAAGTVLAGNGVTAAPSWQTVSGMSTTERQNFALSIIYQAKTFVDPRRLVNLWADGYKSVNGVQASGSSLYAVDTTNGRVAPTITGTTITIDTADSTGSLNTYTSVSLATAVLNSVVVATVGVYSTSALTFKVKICKRNSANNYDVVVDQSFSHGGTGWEDCTLSSPYTVPGSGTYYLGAYTGTGAGPNQKASTNRAYLLGDLTGNGAVTTAEATGTAYALRYTHTVATNNMVVITTAQTSDASVSTARALVEYSPVDAVTLNTDLTLELTCNGGTNWAMGTLASVTAYSQAGRLVAETGATTCTAGTSFQARIKNLNTKNVRVYGITVQVS